MRSLSVLPVAVGLIVLTWDIVLAGWITANRDATRGFTGLTSLCGLTIAPALVIAVASGTEAGARTVQGITWLWPAVALLFVVQVLVALAGRRLSVVVGIPILLYDLALAWVAVGDVWVMQLGTAPIGLQAAVAARDAVVGMTAGRPALVSPYVLLVPMLAPAYPARWRASALVRGVLVLAATVVTTLLVFEWPRGVAAVRSYDRAMAMPSRQRADTDFTLGLRLLPTVQGAPAARTVRADLRLADSVRPRAVLVVIGRDGTGARTLDSLARVLEPLRADSVTIAAALAVGLAPGDPIARERRLAIEQVLVHLEPDVLFPAWIPPIAPVLPHVPPDAAWWRAALLDADALVRRVRPRTRLAWSASRLDPVDSTVYAWAAGADSPVDILAFAAYPSFSGLAGVDARLRAVDRWRAQRAVSGAAARTDAAAADDAPAAMRPHWVATAGGFPHAHGDASQVATIRFVLAWATRREWVRTVIVGEPADYDGRLGLRAANGRERPAVGVVARFSEAMSPRRTFQRD
jgi:hypothetical protein